MIAVPPTLATDRQCLEAWARQSDAESFRLLVARYLAFVYSAAYRRRGDPVHAAEVTRAVFLVLARRARKLRRKTVLAGWLFKVTAVACRKLPGRRKRRWGWFSLHHRNQPPVDGDLWPQAAPEIDAALDRLSSSQRNATLLRFLLNFDSLSAARILRTSDRRAGKQAQRGLKRVTRLLRERGVRTDGQALALACSTGGCAAPLPEGLAFDIIESATRNVGKRPPLKLARRTLRVLAWARWRRRIAVGLPSFVLLLVVLGIAAWRIDARSGHSRLWTAFMLWSVKHEAETVPGLAQPAHPWPVDATAPRLSAATVRHASDLYQTTNIWLAHLKFSREQWKAMVPKRIGPLPNFFQPDGSILLRHPEAQRSGLAGVLGFDFNWAHADFDFGGVSFTNAAARFKGNGTYLTSLYGWKRPFKVDLNKFRKGQKLGAMDGFNFHNLVDDRSFMSDALGYEFFRDAGVPAPRTAYAWLSLSVEGKWESQPLGLYVMVEPVDESFAAERLGSRKTPVFKPVTYQLFEHWGDNWTNYAAIYDLKTKATPEQERRVIEFARLVSSASDAEFAQRLGEFLDLDECARFLAGEVLLSSYDSIFADGQNFYVYLDVRSNKFGFIPWDLDLAWGGFFLLGTTGQRERASIWHPWVGRNRFLERVMAVEEFREIYRGHLEDFMERLFVPDRLDQRIDELAGVIRRPIAAESDFRLEKFELAVSDQPAKRPSDGADLQGANRPVHQLKRFIENRAASVRQQLDGKSKGVILQRSIRK